MPKLSIYLGGSETSFLYFDPPNTCKFFTFPYVYLPTVYNFSREKFFKDVAALAAEQMQVAINACDIVTTGFPEPEDLGMPVKLSVPLNKALASLGKFSYVFVDKFLVMTRENYTCAILPPYKVDYDVENYYSNLSVYKQVKPMNEAELHDYDNSIRGNFVDTKLSFQKGLPIVLSGDRFSCVKEYLTLTYVLALDMIREPGIFSLRLDMDNRLPLYAGLNMLDSGAYNSLDIGFNRLGTLLNAPGGVECLFETVAGKGQLIKVADNDLLAIPLEGAQSARIVIKGGVLRSAEYKITGGDLGFIIDTRDKGNDAFFNPVYRQKHQAAWEKVLSERAGGF